MKIFKNLIILCFLFLFGISLTGCRKYEETREYEVVYARYYETKVEDGTFVIKETVFEKVEFAYININGEYKKHTIYLSDVKLSDETKVVEEEGKTLPKLYLSVKDYDGLFN